MGLSSVAPNSTSPHCVNSQLVSRPPVGILNLLCLICIIFVCYAHLNIFAWNLFDMTIMISMIIIIIIIIIIIVIVVVVIIIVIIIVVSGVHWVIVFCMIVFE